MEVLSLILVFIFGLCIGSFLNVVIWRLPRGEKLTGRSKCAFCGHVLAYKDLFPVFSMAALFGKCRYCKKNISLRYPIIELITGLLFVITFWHYLPYNLFTWLFLLKSLIIISVLIAVFVIDLEHYLILDSIIFPVGIVFLILNIGLDFSYPNSFFSLKSFFLGGIAAGIAAAFPFFLVWHVSKGKWMGFGDIKLLLFLGLSLGWPLIWVGLFLSIILGGAVSIFLLFSSDKTLKSKVPLGTFLALGSVVAIFWGSSILEWYLAFLGF